MPNSMPSPALLLLFMAFAYPVTVGNISANYAFLLFPLIYFGWTGRLRTPPMLIGAAIFVFAAIFVLGGIASIAREQESVERVLFSFVTFISIFAFCIVEVDERMITNFKRAIVVVSLFFCLQAIFKFVSGGGSALGFEQKDLVGSQRYGFMYLVGLYVLLFWRPGIVALQFVKITAITVVTIGLFLTFSRASIVALLASGLLLWGYLVVTGRFGIGASLRLIAGAIAAALFAAILARDFYVLYDFFFERLIERFFLTDSAVILSSETSEGTRLEIWAAILDHTLASPLWGSGYLGTWSLKGIVAGSAHSQYMDVLFRVGFLGAGLWVAILFGAMRNLYHRHQDLFWGVVAVLVYGLFHETFKESHGSFVLAFVVGAYASRMRGHESSSSAVLGPPDLSASHA